MKYASIKANIILLLCSCIFISAKMISSSVPPEGHTGEFSSLTCRACHDGNPLNNPGGSVIVTGLPSTYTPGATYNFSVTITHTNPDRLKWGFSIKANSTSGTATGTFSTTNSNAIINGAELSHQDAPLTAASGTYTFNNLSWRAPSSPVLQEQTVTFYLAGNAANGDLNSTGDFICTFSKQVTLQPTSVIENIPGVENWAIQQRAGNLTIQMNLTEVIELSVSLYSLNGEIVLQQPSKRYLPGKQQIQIDSKKITTGIYILVLKNGHTKSARKIVI